MSVTRIYDHDGCELHSWQRDEEIDFSRPCATSDYSEAMYLIVIDPKQTKARWWETLIVAELALKGDHGILVGWLEVDG